MKREETFIAELNRKKDQAWQELYTNFYPALCSYACRLVRDRNVAEDIVQECLIRLWDSVLQFPNIRALAAYLFRSVYHRSLNMIRDQHSAQKALLEFREGELMEPDETTAIEWAVEENVVSRLRTVISSLSPQQQQVLTLSMEGRKVREIAECLGVSENTVKMQKKRAYAEVREQMGRLDLILLLTFFRNIF